MLKCLASDLPPSSYYCSMEESDTSSASNTDFDNSSNNAPETKNKQHDEQHHKQHTNNNNTNYENHEHNATGQRLIKNPDKMMLLTIEEAVNRISTGRFQYQILFAAGTCFMADSMEISLLALLTPVLKREWDWGDQNQNGNGNGGDDYNYDNYEKASSSSSSSIADTKLATITAFMFVGALCGTSILGPLGDKIGRLPILFTAASIISIFGVLTAFCTGFLSLLFARFIVGFGIGALTVPFDILAEVIPGDKRGEYLLLIEYFWTAGSIMVPIAGYITLEVYDSWRVFVIVCALPCMVSFVAGRCFVPESPHWLVSVGRHDEALEILRQGAQLNGLDSMIVFPHGCRIVDKKYEHEYDHEYDRGHGHGHGHGHKSEQLQLQKQKPDTQSKTFKDLFVPRWRRTTILLFCVWSTVAINYYGTIMITTRLFNRDADDNDNNDDESGMDYMALLISSSAEIVGTAISIGLIDRIGRVKLLTWSAIIGGTSLFFLCILVDTDIAGRWELIGLSFVSRICEMSGSCTLWVLTAEMFSTDIRSTGHSATNAMARIGGFASPYLVSGNVSFRLIAACMLILHAFTAFCAWKLPETMGMEMGKAASGAGAGAGADSDPSGDRREGDSNSQSGAATRREVVSLRHNDYDEDMNMNMDIDASEWTGTELT